MIEAGFDMTANTIMLLEKREGRADGSLSALYRTDDQEHTDAIKMRAMDIELPDAWFETPEDYL